jgi:predicted Zn-dependent protease
VFVRTAWRIVVGLSLAGTLAVGCALNPVSGRPEIVLVSVRQEQQIGAEQAQQVERSIGLIDNAALTAYVAAIGQRLAAHSPRQDIEYRFHVVDMVEPNAFALPGGYVYVTRGLLALANSEDELAGVIGHEIGHVAARHAVQQVSRTAPFALITNLSAAVTGLASPLLGQLVGGVGGLASGLVLAPFDREQEREADRIGQQLAAEAGWDPAAIANFLRTLEREEAIERHGSQRFDFLASHPSTPERIANTTTFAATLHRAALAPLSRDRAAFLARLDGLVVGTPAAHGVFEGQHFLHPVLNFSVRFPDNWKTQNSRAEVMGVAPDDTALITLAVVAEGDDPLAGARALEKSSGSSVIQQTQPVMIGDLKAAGTRLRARSREGELGVNLVWIAHGGRIYQLVGATPLARGDAFQPVFEAVMQSFRPLRPAERAGIREDHLRIIAARTGETLTALAARSSTTWTPDMMAVANGLSSADPLAAAALVKVAVAEPYSP